MEEIYLARRAVVTFGKLFDVTGEKVQSVLEAISRAIADDSLTVRLTRTENVLVHSCIRVYLRSSVNLSFTEDIDSSTKGWMQEYRYGKP